MQRNKSCGCFRAVSGRLNEHQDAASDGRDRPRVCEKSSIDLQIGVFLEIVSVFYVTD
jgi:hypothetical protein